MTTESQKDLERQSLQHLLSILDITLTAAPEPGETPDFILSTSKGEIGVEVTTFQSGVMTDDGVSRRSAEAAWDSF